MSNVTATLRPGRSQGPHRNLGVNLGAIAQEMARYAPDISIRVLGADGAVTAVFGRRDDDDDMTLF
jgi:hypothetical protein